MVLTKGAEKHFAEHIIRSRQIFDSRFWINLFYFSGIFEEIPQKKLRIKKIAQTNASSHTFIYMILTLVVLDLFIYFLS